MVINLCEKVALNFKSNLAAYRKNVLNVSLIDTLLFLGKFKLVLSNTCSKDELIVIITKFSCSVFSYLICQLSI